MFSDIGSHHLWEYRLIIFLSCRFVIQSLDFLKITQRSHYSVTVAGYLRLVHTLSSLKILLRAVKRKVDIYILRERRHIPPYRVALRPIDLLTYFLSI